MLLFVLKVFILFPILWYCFCMSNPVALLVSFPNPTLKTECKFTCELSDICQKTTRLNFFFFFVILYLEMKIFFVCVR